MSMQEAFNEWMRRYVEEPERFQQELTTVKEFMTQQNNGEEPSYGDHSAAYLISIMEGN